MTPAQCRAARGMLNWTQDKLAEASRISVITVRNFELGKSKPQQSTLYLMQQAFEQEGIEFINGNAPGVRMKPR